MTVKHPRFINPDWRLAHIVDYNFEDTRIIISSSYALT